MRGTIQEIGRVAGLNRFPVKSMRGEPVEALALGWTGFDGDRQYAFCHAGNTSSFPWLTGRDVSQLVLYEARYADPADTRQSTIRVTAPDGETYDVRSPALAARLSAAAGSDVFLLQVGRGTFDSGQVSVVSSLTLSALAQSWGAPLDTERFRQNIVVDGNGDNEWLGGTLLFGDADDGPRLRIDRPILRCAMITIDPHSAVREPRILRMVAKSFANEVGVYGSTENAGVVRVGDRVRIVR